MFSKPVSKADKEARYLLVKKNIEGLEKQPVIVAWHKWNRLDDEAQKKIMAKWDQYYIDMRETPSHLIYMEQRKALKQGSMTRVKELAEDARKIMKDKAWVLTKPTSFDPFTFIHDDVCKRYREYEREVKELTSYPDIGHDEELKEVFGMFKKQKS